MTPSEFYYAWIGWVKLRIDNERAAWERTRWNTALLMLIQVDDKHRDGVFKMTSLPWDVTDAIPEIAMSMDDRKVRVEEILKTINNGEKFS